MTYSVVYFVLLVFKKSGVLRSKRQAGPTQQVNGNLPHFKTYLIE